MYDIPEGYRFIGYRKANEGEHYLRYGKVLIAQSENGSEWPIVEKIPEQGQSSHNTKRRRHADLIHAWAEGAEIQYQKANGSWDCVFENYPTWSDCEIYRIKPKTRIVRFRNWLSEDGNIYAATEDWGQDLKWLGDWQEVEIE